MTYNAGQNIQAADYNTFATLFGGINEVYADLHSGAITVAVGADFGYGQTSTLTSVSAGANITASQWASLFTVMKNCGLHQNTTTVPPLPVTSPVIGNNIVTYNTPSTLSSLLTTLRTNRFNLGAGQSAQTSTSLGGPGPWTNTLVFTFSVNLGTWDQTRYFFNSGGFIGLSGSYPASGYPTNTDDYQWYTMLDTMGTAAFRAKSTSASSGTGTAIGLWNGDAPIGTTYVPVYSKIYGGGGFYTNSTIVIEARQSAAAPTAGSGTIQFRITLTQTDSNLPINPKLLTTTFTMSETHSAGTFAWPGTATITPGSFIYT